LRKPPEQPRRRNLLIVRAGDDSLHPDWLEGAVEREFDLLVSYYGAQPGHYREQADIYHEMAGPRWPAHHAICREHASTLRSYDFVAFACDDLRAGLATWNALFSVCRSFRLDLAQPAIEGDVTFPITRPVEGCLLRYTNFVEIMCPVFSRRALAGLHPTFGESVSGWGLDYLWQKFLVGKGEIAVIDSVRVAHARPLRVGTLYTRLAEQKIDPWAEMAAVLARSNVTTVPPREIRRVPLPAGVEHPAPAFDENAL
jgi:hypothetical protein